MQGEVISDRTRYTTRQFDKATRMVAAGSSIQQIAEAMGQSYAQTLFRIRRAGITLPPMRGRPLSPEKHRQVLSLLRETDLSQRQIAERVGCSQHAVNTRYRAIKNERRRDLESAGEFQPIKTQKAIHCPVHGRV